MNWIHVAQDINTWKVVSILLGISPASEVYKPTFWNSVSVPSSWASRNLYTPDTGEIPERILTTFRTFAKNKTQLLHLVGIIFTTKA